MSDLLKVNTRELLRPGRIARTFLVVSVLVFVFFVFAKGLPQSPKSWSILAVGAFEEGGLLEKTVANETLIKWGGARALHMQKDYFLLEIAPGMHHIFPRRAFDADTEFHAFASMADRLLLSRA